MKKAFSLFEIIIVIVIISLISTFLIIKTSSSIEFTNKTSVKADIAQIRSAISKVDSKNILLDTNKITKLDDSNTEEENSLLFSNVLENAKLSTTSSKKEIGKWIKSSSNKYKVFISNTEYLEFEFINSSFKCLSEIDLCKEFE